MPAITLGDEIAADDKKDENPDQPKDALIGGNPKEGFVHLAALGNQEGMRKHHRQRSQEPHGVEIVGMRAGWSIFHRSGRRSLQFH
jgi:hypothetical protein